MTELIMRANLRQLRALCLWLWGFFITPTMSKYVAVTDWETAARTILDTNQ